MELAGIVELNASDPFESLFRRGQVGLNCGAWGIEWRGMSVGLSKGVLEVGQSIELTVKGVPVLDPKLKLN